MNVVENAGPRADPSPQAELAAAGEYLTFRLGAEEYGVDILAVQEIRGYEQPVHIANAPAYFKGVMTVRGAIVPILDLRLRLNLERAEYDAFTITVMLHMKERVVGLVVDAVSDVVALDASQIKPAPAFHGCIDPRFIIGIGAVKDGERERMLILADLERIIDTDDAARGDSVH